MGSVEEPHQPLLGVHRGVPRHHRWRASCPLGISYDRQSPLLLQGNGSSQITGAIYAPASTWDYNGNSDVNVTGGPVILKSMTGNGTTGVRILNGLDAEVLKLPGDIGLDE